VPQHSRRGARSSVDAGGKDGGQFPIDAGIVKTGVGPHRSLLDSRRLLEAGVS